MIKTKTVLILGAGASNAYGFPLGQELLYKVCAINPDDPTALLLKGAGYDADLLSEFVHTLKNSGYTSVDWFLEDYPKFAAIGKASIAATLIPCEKSEKLFPPAVPPEAHWYQLLINSMDAPRGAFAENQLSVVTFNYDRSLEYYLFQVLKARRNSEDRAVEELRTLSVVHVHGQLGGLIPLVEDGRSYSADLRVDTIRDAAEQIVVVGEAKDDDAAFEAARCSLSDAERIVFLGFGFHPESVRRLGVFNEPWDDERRERVRVGGSARGIPERHWKEIRENVLNQAFPAGVPRAYPIFKYLTEVGPLDE